MPSKNSAPMLSTCSWASSRLNKPKPHTDAFTPFTLDGAGTVRDQIDHALKETDVTVEQIDTVVIGAGQAGVAMCEHLSRLEIPYLVLERQRIAERWRSERWDSLVCNGPAWHGWGRHLLDCGSAGRFAGLLLCRENGRQSSGQSCC